MKIDRDISMMWQHQAYLERERKRGEFSDKSEFRRFSELPLKFTNYKMNCKVSNIYTFEDDGADSTSSYESFLFPIIIASQIAPNSIQDIARV